MLRPTATKECVCAERVDLPRETMEWLAHEWPSRMHGEPPASFAKRYAESFVHEKR